MVKTTRYSGRPTVAEVDLGALEFNYRQLQKKIPQGVNLLAVVKADSYGHGALPISLRLEKLGVEYLGVAIPEEGVELRRGGVKAPILILGGIYGQDVEKIIRFDLTPVIFDKGSLKLLSKEAERRRRKVKKGEGPFEGGYRDGETGGSVKPVACFFERIKAISKDPNRRDPLTLFHDR